MGSAGYTSRVRPERTIVILKQYLGDGVMCEPLLTTLAENYSRVDVLALPPVQQVLGQLDSDVNFVVAEKIKTLRETMNLARRLRRKSYDVAILVNRSFRSALLARLAKIPLRIGHGTEGRSFLLTRSVRYEDGDFEAKSYIDLARAAGIDADRIEPALRLRAAEQTEGLARVDGAVVAIQPGARHGYKQIPAPILAEVARAVQARGLGIVLIGGAEETEAAAQLKGKLGRPVVDLVGQTGIRQTMGVLANVRVAVGGDTGVMHLAAGLGTPTVTCFGPTPAVKWGHHYAPHRVIQAEGGEIAKLDPGVIRSTIFEILGP